MGKTNEVKVKSEFFKITGIPPFHPTNYIENKQARNDIIFDALADKVFDHPKLLFLLTKKIKKWLSIDDSEFVHSLAGYIFYIKEDFNNAKRHFLKAIEKNPHNLDNWLDLAFSLYHLGGKREKLAKDIFFNFGRYIRLYTGNKSLRTRLLKGRN